MTFLRHIVGQGQVRHVEANIEAISDLPVPTGKRQLMRVLGMAGYFRRFCYNFFSYSCPDSNAMLDPRGQDVDRSHLLRGSDVGNPRRTNASLLVGATWDPHDGFTSDPHMPECRFHVEPTFEYFLSLFLFFKLYFHYLISSFNCYIFHILHPLIKTMPSVLLRTTFTPTAQEMQLKGSNLRIFTTSELSCILI